MQNGSLKIRPHYTMITNLTLLDNKALTIIQKNDIDLTVSLDGPAEINDQLRVDSSGAGSYDMVCKAIEKCKDNIVGIEATFTKLHEQQGWTMGGLRSSLASTFQIKEDMIYVCPATGDKDYCFAPEEAKSRRLKINGLDSGSIHCLHALNPMSQSDLLCNAGYTVIALLPNGDLYPCHFYALDRSYCIGTYDSQGYQNIANQLSLIRKRLSLINKFSHNECKNCWARNICHRCPAELLIVHPQRGIDFQCTERRESMKRHLIEGLETFF